jgi:tripartite-type tricarboxylate transporter receptor subunit TctC
MRTLISVVAFAATLASIGSASAQPYPTRPITVVVPFAAGGGLDATGRAIADRVRATLGQSVIIENVTGANGSIGVGRVARAAGDGYTLSLGSWSTFVSNGAAYALPYDLLEDFEPVALVATVPLLIVAKKALPANDLKGLIAWLKDNPDKASAGTSGAGSIQHVAAIHFQNKTDTRFGIVPYRGGAPSLQDLVAGQIDLIFSPTADSAAQVRGGSIRAYAVAAKTRLAAAPDIPTVDEAGLPDFYFSNWYALWAPRGTPKTIIDKLNAAVVGALAEPNLRAAGARGVPQGRNRKMVADHQGSEHQG